MLKKECDNCGKIFGNYREGADINVNLYSKIINLCKVCFDEEIKPALENMDVIGGEDV